MVREVKLKKTVERTYLKIKTNETTNEVGVTYLEVLTKEKGYDCYFKRWRTAWKVNITVLVFINKEIRCAWCISREN